MMILFCEVNKTGLEHALINSKLLIVLARIFPDSPIYARVSQSHWESIYDGRLGKHVVPVFEPVVTAVNGNKWRWVVKLLTECKLSFRVLREANRNDVALVFFASSSPLGNLFISVLVKFFFKKRRVIITLHGELQLLVQRGGKRVDRLYARFLRFAFEMKLPSRRYLVLDKYVHERLIAYNFLPEGGMMAIRHPLTYEETETQPVKAGRSVVFGHLGVAKLEKRSSLFFELASRFQPEIATGSVRFVIAGQSLKEMRPFENSWVEYNDGEELVGYDAYRSSCLQMQYAIFFYDDNGYELISSGAIMDAISFEIPIIALKNPYFARLFEACEIPPGILCDNVDELHVVVQQAVNAEGQAYERMKTGMKLLKKEFDLEQIEVDFSTQLMEFLR